ncbi:MAG TPA: phosphatidate cytidylyltransferase [Acidimicrobiales bacterium]|nr:phosphatidate cytidylyltransferase [Acidimicrobiales bacterium]
MDEQDDDVDEQDDDQDDDQGRQEHLAGVDWSTERVRIVGAETAAVLTGEIPVQAPLSGEAVVENPADTEDHYLGSFPPASPPPTTPPPPLPLDGGELAAVPVELPHWSEPATGQVPAIIDSRSDEDGDTAWAAFTDSGPVWREHEHEWQDTGGFEPAMLADEETRVGALSEPASEESRPWEFDDLTPPAGEQAVAGSVGKEESFGHEHEAQSPLPKHGRQRTGESTDPGASSSGDFWSARPAAFLSEPSDQLGDHQAELGSDERLFDAPRSAQLGKAGPQVAGSATSGAGGRAPSWWDEDSDTRQRSSASATPTTAEPTVSGPATARSVVIERRPPEDLVAPPPRSASLAKASAARHAARPARPAPSDAATSSTRRVSEGAAGGGRNVPLAVISGLIAVGVVLGCFALGSLATEVLATVAVTLAAAETYAAFRRAGLRPATLVGLVATVGLMIAVYDKGVTALPLIGALVVVTTMVWYLIGAESGSPVAGISSTLLGFVWVGVLGSFAALLLAPSVYPHRHGVAFAFGAVVATVATDVGALAVGSWLGRHQLAPHVSPNKTWEGWAGGAVLAVLASAFITGHMHPWTPGKAAVLGAVVAVVAPLGDLCESLVKRDLGIKDMGSLIPGHGGVLDRMDALLFALPATYFLVRVLHLG